MNPDSPELWNNPQTEARIVAWVLGEASDFEIAELEKLIEKSPELKAYYERTVSLHGRLTHAHEAPQGRWTIEKTKRGELLGKIGAVDSVKKDSLPKTELQSASRKIIPVFVWSAVITCAACLALAFVVISSEATKNEKSLMVGVSQSPAFEVQKVSDDPDRKALKSKLRTLYAGWKADSSEDESFEKDFASIPKDALASPLAKSQEILTKSERIQINQLSRSQRFTEDVAPPAQSEYRVATAASLGNVPYAPTEIVDVIEGFGEGEDFGEGFSDLEEESVRTLNAGRAFTTEESRKVARNRSNVPSPNIAMGEQLSELASMDLKDPFQTEATSAALRISGRSQPIEESKKDVSGGRKAEISDLKQNLTDPFRTDDAPIRTNPALSLENHSKVDDVRRNFYKAGGFFDLGNYDEAEQAYREVLRTDKYNKAARRGLEQIESVKSDYYLTAYDHTRAELLAKVDKAWELSVPEGKKKEKGLLELSEEIVPPSANAPLHWGWESEDNGGEVAGGAILTAGIRSGQFGIDESNLALLDDLADLPSSKNVQSRDVQLGALVIPQNRVDALGFDWDTDSFGLAEAEVSAGDRLRLVDGLDVLGKAGGANTNRIIKIPALKKPVPIRSFRSETSASDEAFSTFSLNVSDVSFQLAQSALIKNEWPAAEKIRSEEFVNAFDYGDSAPAVGQPVTCVLEQSIHPFLQQRNLFRFGVRTAAAGRASSVPLRLTLLIDQSGSMERTDRQEALQAGMKVLVGLLSEQDQVSVIGFSRRSRLLADRVKGSDAKTLLSAVKYTPSEGGTNLENALKLAEETAQKHYFKGAQNRIVLITDGAANLGNAIPEDLSKMIEALRQKGISFDACGVSADDLNDQLLEQMARKGDGRYYLLDRAADADASFAKKLAGAFRPAAQDVKVQVVFNPERVGKYQLIGFEKHRLKKEDFRDNSINAAELAAEESGVALYHAEIKADGQGEVGEVFVRFRDAATRKIVERNWVIPYESQPRPFDKAATSLQLAGIAAFTGEHLAGSPLAQQIDWSRLKPSFSRIRSAYPANQRVLQLEQMIEKISR